MRYIEGYAKEYSEDRLREKMRRIAKKIGSRMAYAVLTAYYAVQSDALSLKEKVKLYGALGYFILPTDLIPDAVIAIGYTDDLAALIYVLRTVSQAITPEVKAKAREKMLDWFGEDELSDASTI